MRKAHLIGAGLAALFALTPALARAGGETEVPLFAITKSENKNEVVYAVRLDAACRPIGEAPVHAYWRMREKEPVAIEPLLWLEEPAYGVGGQALELSPEGASVVRFQLRALPERKIAVRISRTAEGCAAVAITTIADQGAILSGVYVRLRTFGIDSLTLNGSDARTGAALQETLKP